jgi:hypothetical protein
MIETLHDRAEEVPVLDLQLDLVDEGFDAGVLERIEYSPDRANVIDSPQSVRVRVLGVVWRPAVVLARRMIARFDKAKNGVERLAAFLSAIESALPPRDAHDHIAVALPRSAHGAQAVDHGGASQISLSPRSLVAF